MTPLIFAEMKIRWRLGEIERDLRAHNGCLGRMNVYGPEGLKVSAKERERIKKEKEHGGSTHHFSVLISFLKHIYNVETASVTAHEKNISKTTLSRGE